MEKINHILGHPELFVLVEESNRIKIGDQENNGEDDDKKVMRRLGVGCKDTYRLYVPIHENIQSIIIWIILFFNERPSISFYG